MEPFKIQQLRNGRFLLINNAAAATAALRKAIEETIPGAIKTSGGSIALGEIYETYKSARGEIEVCYDEGFGYEFWSDDQALNQALKRALENSSLFLVEQRT